MEGTKNKVAGLIILLLFPVFLATAQKKNLTDYQCAFFESYRHGDMSPWPGLIAEMGEVKSADLAWQTEMLKAIYGLVGYEIGKHEKDLARNYIDQFDIYMDKLLDEHPENAQLHSLSGAIYGYKISLAIYKAPFLGPKSLYHIDKAIELDPAEPMGYIEKGNSLMYRPTAFGGNKMEGLTYYRKALKLMDSRNAQPCDWQKMLLRAFILKDLYETEQNDEAKVFMQKMQTDYGSMDWIKQFVGASYMDEK
jgi:hypothetical protein